MPASKTLPVFANTTAAQTAVFPTSLMPTFEFFDRATDAGEVVLTGTIPASAPYAVQCPVPLKQTDVVVTVATNARTVRAGLTSPGTGFVGFDAITGKFVFNAADAGLAYSITLTPFATVIVGDFLERFQAEVLSVQTVTQKIGVSQTQHFALMAPDDANGVPEFRLITIPDVDGLTAALLAGGGVVSVDIYVNNVAGDDVTGTGTENNPVETIAGATALIATLAAGGGTDFVVHLAASATAYEYDPTSGGGTTPFPSDKSVSLVGVPGQTTVELTGYTSTDTAPDPDDFTLDVYLTGGWSGVSFVAIDPASLTIRDYKVNLFLDSESVAENWSGTNSISVTRDGTFDVKRTGASGYAVVRNLTISGAVRFTNCDIDGATSRATSNLTLVTCGVIRRLNLTGGVLGACLTLENVYASGAVTVTATGPVSDIFSSGVISVTGESVSNVFGESTVGLAATFIRSVYSAGNLTVTAGFIADVQSEGFLQVNTGWEYLDGIRSGTGSVSIQAPDSGAALGVINNLVCSPNSPKADGAIFNFTGLPDNQVVEIRNSRIVYTGNYAEHNDDPVGIVAILKFFNSNATVVFDHCVIETTTLCMMLSHVNPAVDPGRNTKTQHVIIRNSRLSSVMGAVDGPADNPTNIVTRAANGSTLTLENCDLRLDCSAMTTDHEPQANISASTSHTTGSNTITIRDCRFSFKGTTTASVRAPLAWGHVTGSGTLNVVADGLHILQQDNADYTILNTEGNWTVRGFSGVAALTTEEAITLDGHHRLGSLTLGTALPIASGGTGSTTAANARTALGLGTMATQAASAVAITGGTVAGTLSSSEDISVPFIAAIAPVVTPANWTKASGGLTYIETSTAGEALFLELQVPAGTVLKSVSLKHGSTGAGTPINCRIFSIPNTGTSTTYTTQADLSVASTGALTTITTTTFDFSDITIAADTSYIIQFRLSSTGSIRAYAGALNFGNRKL